MMRKPVVQHSFATDEGENRRLTVNPAGLDSLSMNNNGRRYFHLASIPHENTK